MNVYQCVRICRNVYKHARIGTNCSDLRLSRPGDGQVTSMGKMGEMGKMERYGHRWERVWQRWESVWQRRSLALREKGHELGKEKVELEEKVMK